MMIGLVAISLYFALASSSPQGETLLGPMLLVLVGGPGLQAWGIGLSLLLASCILTVIVRPRPWSITLAVFAAMAWWCLGLSATGINC
jgi:hypothetical protein